MSVTYCDNCDRNIDEDFDVDHVNECFMEYIWENMTIEEADKFNKSGKTIEDFMEDEKSASYTLEDIRNFLKGGE